MDVHAFLADITKRTKQKTVASREAYWNAMASGKAEDYARCEQLELERIRLFQNKEEYELVKKFLNETHDAATHRQLVLFHNEYLAAQGDPQLLKTIIEKATAVEKAFNTKRAVIDGKEYTDNEIKEILRTSTDQALLQKAWEAYMHKGEAVQHQVTELAHLRNKLAKSLGFKDFHVMSLHIGEQTQEQILTIFDELAHLTDKPFHELKNEIDEHLRKKHGVEHTRPWHYQDPFFQSSVEIYSSNVDEYYNLDMVPVAKEFYASIGLPVDEILAHSDLYEREGKYQHACCLDVDGEGDVRIMQNMKPGEYWAETTLHELGHGVHFKYMDRKMPWVLRASHTLVTEAIAQLFGRLSKNPAFMKRYTKISPAELEHIKVQLYKTLRMRQLVFSRWSQVMFRFEKEMYANPNQDLDALWASLVKKYQLLDLAGTKGKWAAKIHLSVYPCYYHNYLLGELYASQIHNTLCTKVIGTTNLREADYAENLGVGTFLSHKIFALGHSVPWNDLVEKSTGEKLSAKHYVKQFVD